jgi:acyl-CoA thioesterase-1
MNDSVVRFHCSVEQARANLESMINRINHALPRCRIVLQVMNPVVGKSATSRPHLESYYQMYRDVAAKRKLLLIDHGPTWKAVLVAGEDDYRKVVPDGLHPSAEGYRKHVTPAILEALTP